MKKIINLAIVFLLSIASYAQENGAISLGAFVSNERGDIPTESVSFLTNRMKRLIAANGYAENKPTGRFALLVTCDILSKEVAPTTPPKISLKLEIAFLVVDWINNKIFESCNMVLNGIGNNETKAYNAAFQKINVQNPTISQMLEKVKVEILEYYTNSCPTIMTEASTLASMDEYDKAIFSLVSVPDVCAECYAQCQALASKIYQQRIDVECVRLLEQAKSSWESSPNAATATAVGELLGKIDPRSSGYNHVITFRTTVSEKLNADAAREWEFEMRKYEDNQQFKRSILDACKAVGEAFAKNFKPQINIHKIRKY